MRSSACLASLAVVCCSIAVLAAACGSSADDSAFGSSGSSGSAGASGGASNGGFGTSGTSGNGSCFAPVDMYIVFDKSGSMGDPVGNGAPGDCNIGDTKNSKWCHAINALAGYLSSPSAKDQSAALQFFSGADNAV